MFFQLKNCQKNTIFLTDQYNSTAGLLNWKKCDNLRLREVLVFHV